MAPIRRMIHWSGDDPWRAEAGHVMAVPQGMRASGVQMGVDPRPYRLEYLLEADADWHARHLKVAAAGDGWNRMVELTSDGAGHWTCVGGGEGAPDLPAAGGDSAALEGAFDVDLAFSPMTNLIPVRRAGLHLGPGPVLDLVAAWVSVPDLAVHRSEQRYENVRASLTDAVVRYVDRGVHDGFTAELHLDREGVVIDYPGLARMVTAP
ncbi:MAG: uncharacterized protein QOD86_2463 [Miltoncostaeaceae bacterium]|jgi:hypothetical protein|nr:uncharacterized protein [Miltoncostaeaceae bacterium]